MRTFKISPGSRMQRVHLGRRGGPGRMLAGVCAVVVAGFGFASAAAAYTQTNLVADTPGPAPNVDPNLVGPWGLAHSGTSPWWVANHGSGNSTLYDGTGQILPLVVSVPAPGGVPASPTGVAFNGGGGFGGDRFLFATEQGGIAGWQAALGTQASLRVDRSYADAVYKGIATANNGAGDFLYAANFYSGTIDVFDASFGEAFLTGNFTDPTLPSGYAPFNIQNLGGNLYVSYALRDQNGQSDVPGAGHGFVDVFDPNGNLVRRVATDGPLNSPWGLALAPSDFGALSNSLLVGNAGDGKIQAYDPITGAYRGMLLDDQGDPIAIDGLRGLAFGNDGGAGAHNTLYFTAGPTGTEFRDAHGLFGYLSTDAAPAPVPEPQAWVLLSLGLCAVGARSTLRRRRSGAGTDLPGRRI